ncbi:hypothetical protein CDAR_32031 [Caerostris darwini]|uniref:Uncharacterized protein n=1 Tax=Caerostris darwini TaxID=1538125 RepID=A0AAV4RPQ7_9ARAC|nr:hypothetical protein CDAR_32031 [Caerostris darwini]
MFSPRSSIVVFILITLFSLQVAGKDACLWCNKIIANDYMTCLVEKLKNHETFGKQPALLDDMKKSLLAANDAMTKTKDDSRNKIMMGALAGEMSVVVASSFSQNRDDAVAKTTRLAGECYTSITGSPNLNFMNSLGRKIADMIDDSEPDNDNNGYVPPNNNGLPSGNRLAPNYNYPIQPPGNTNPGIPPRDYQPLQYQETPFLPPNYGPLPISPPAIPFKRNFAPVQPASAQAFSSSGQNIGNQPPPAGGPPLGFDGHGSNAFASSGINNPQSPNWPTGPSQFRPNLPQLNQPVPQLPRDNLGILPILQPLNFGGVPASNGIINNQWNPINGNNYPVNQPANIQPPIIENNPNYAANAGSANIPDYTKTEAYPGDNYQPSGNFNNNGPVPNGSGASASSATSFSDSRNLPQNNNYNPNYIQPGSNVGNQQQNFPQPVNTFSSQSSNSPLYGGLGQQPNQPQGAQSTAIAQSNGRGNDMRQPSDSGSSFISQGNSANAFSNNYNNGPQPNSQWQRPPTNNLLQLNNQNGQYSEDNIQSRGDQIPITNESTQTQTASAQTTTKPTEAPTMSTTTVAPTSKACAMEFAEVIFVQLSKSDSFGYIFGTNTPHDIAVLAAEIIVKQALDNYGLTQYSDEAAKYCARQVSQLQQGATKQAYAEKISKSVMVTFYKNQIFNGDCKMTGDSFSKTIIETLGPIFDVLNSNDKSGTGSNDQSPTNQSTGNSANKNNDASQSDNIPNNGATTSAVATSQGQNRANSGNNIQNFPFSWNRNRQTNQPKAW